MAISCYVGLRPYLSNGLRHGDQQPRIDQKSKSPSAAHAKTECSVQNLAIFNKAKTTTACLTAPSTPAGWSPLDLRSFISRDASPKTRRDPHRPQAKRTLSENPPARKDYLQDDNFQSPAHSHSPSPSSRQPTRAILPPWLPSRVCNASARRRRVRFSCGIFLCVVWFVDGQLLT